MTTLIETRPDVKKQVGGDDAIHDFRTPRVLESQETNVYNRLVAILYSFIPFLPNQPTAIDPSTYIQDARNYTSWLSASTQGGVTSSSNVEDQTVTYYEDKFPLELRTANRKQISYNLIRDTIKGSAGNGINEQIFNAGVTLGLDDCDILELDLEGDDDWDIHFSQDDKRRIGIFILNFFFPPAPDSVENNSRVPTYISFDAGSSMPDKIFGSMDQVVNLVTPLNIADSATTNTHLGGQRNYYYFPDETEFIYTSSVFTETYRPGIQLGISKNVPTAQYEHNTRYDFSIFVKDEQNQRVIQSFDKDHTSGPGVTYLSAFINELNPTTPTTPTTPPTLPPKSDTAGPNQYLQSKILDIYAFVTGLLRLGFWVVLMLLFDLKRSGDWEQCNATKNANITQESPTNGRSILCTIDRLCALYSRMIEQHTIYHYSTKLILYRFKRDVTPLENARKTVTFYSKKLTEIQYTVQNATRIKTELTRSVLYTRFETAVFLEKGSKTKIDPFMTGLAIMQFLKFKEAVDSVVTILSEEQNARIVEAIASAPSVNDEPDLDDLRGITEQLVNSISYIEKLSGFYDLISKLIKKDNATTTAANFETFLGSILEKPVIKQIGQNLAFSKGELFAYNYKVLENMQKAFAEISLFNPESRKSNLLHYPTNLENSTEFVKSIKLFVSSIYPEFDSDPLPKLTYINTDEEIQQAITSISSGADNNYLKVCNLLYLIATFDYPSNAERPGQYSGLNKKYVDLCGMVYETIYGIISSLSQYAPPPPPSLTIESSALPPPAPQSGMEIVGGTSKINQFENLRNSLLLEFTVLCRKLSDMTDNDILRFVNSSSKDLYDVFNHFLKKTQFDVDIDILFIYFEEFFEKTSNIINDFFNQINFTFDQYEFINEVQYIVYVFFFFASIIFDINYESEPGFTAYEIVESSMKGNIKDNNLLSVVIVNIIEKYGTSSVMKTVLDHFIMYLNGPQTKQQEIEYGKILSNIKFIINNCFQLKYLNPDYIFNSTLLVFTIINNLFVYGLNFSIIEKSQVGHYDVKITTFKDKKLLNTLLNSIIRRDLTDTYFGSKRSSSINNVNLKNLLIYENLNLFLIRSSVLLIFILNKPKLDDARREFMTHTGSLAKLKGGKKTKRKSIQRKMNIQRTRKPSTNKKRKTRKNK